MAGRAPCCCSNAADRAVLFAGDTCTALAARKSVPAAHQGFVLTVSILATSLAFIDGSVVSVALPAIGRSLAGDAAALQWVVNAYTLPLSALLLLAGAVGDRFGTRRILIFGIVLFGAGSVLCALAPDLPFLLVARGLQGIGSAFVLPNSLAILGSTFSGEARGRAVGTWSAASAVAAALGPVIGGALIDSFGWRTIFLINIPLAILAIALAFAFVREPPHGEKEAPLDYGGAALATLALLALIWGLTVGAGPAHWPLAALLAVMAGLALLSAFAGVEWRRGDAAMMPLSLFGSRDFVGLTLLTLLLYGAFTGLLTLLPFVLIAGHGYSGTAAGAALLPFPLLLAVVSRFMGTIAARLGPRLPLTIGPAVVGLGFLLFLRIGMHADYWRDVLPPILVIALGMGASAAPLTNAVLSSVDTRHEGVASGFNSAVARAGGLVATALIGFVLAAKGAALYAAFHEAVIAFALTAFASAACTWIWVGRSPPGEDR